MPRFRFELEAVLKERERVEQRRQLALAELQAERARIEDRIRAAQSDVEAGRRFVRDAVAPGVDRTVGVAAVRLAAHSALHTTIRVQRLGLELAGVYQKQQAARAELLKAAVARKAVEALRTRRYNVWLAEQNKRETAALDEINTQRAMMPGGDLA